MEFLSSSILSKPHIFSAISPLTPPSSLTTLCKKTPYKFRQTQLKSFSNSPFLTNSPNRNRSIHIVARFGRPTRRRNSLRKKLTSGGDLQVRQNPQKSIDPVHHLVDNQENDSILSVDSLERGSGKLGGNSNLENSWQSGESVLWNKLEGWVEQYKNDSEFWGIGSNPIFTVFQDSSGNVKQVLVDEDEILRRNGVEPLYFKGKELGDFGDVNLKILHAKHLAKEVEDGNNVIPRNSSVAKFVVSGEKLGFVSTIKSIFVPQYSLAKVSRIGIAMVCGFVFVWVIKKIFTLQAKEPELTGLEKEMLRRKMRSRLVTEKLKKGSIEIVEEPSDSLTVFAERPRLDKEEILNNIREAKGLNNSLVVPNDGGAQETASTEMDIKIREIQIMARHARKIERGEGIASEEDEFDKQVIPCKLQLVEEDAVEGSKDSDVLSSVEKDVSDEFAGADKNPSNDLPNENSAEPRFVHGNSETEILGNLKMQSSDVSFTSEKIYEEHEDVEPHNSLSRKITDDEKTNINGLLQSHEISNSSNLTEGIQSYIYSSQLNSSKKTPLRRKPKIIRSVKEAREYLLHKHNSMDQEGDIPTAAAINDKGMDNSFSQRSGEEDETPESFDVGSIVPDLKVSGRCNANEHLATDTNALRVKTESELKQKRPDDLSSAENSGVALNMGTTMKIDGMFKHCVSHEKLDLVTDENDDDSQKSLLTKKSMEGVEELDETVKSTDLSEIADPASGRNGCQVASVFHENAHHDANLNGKIYLSGDGGKVSLGESNEISKPTEQSEILVPAAVGRNRDRCDTEDNAFLPIDINEDEREYGNHQEESKHLTTDTLKGSAYGVDDKDEALFAEKENWLEKNFHEVEPIVKTIGSGFRNNYNVAREKIKQEVNSQLDLTKLRSMKDDTELEWMKDDKLREIVFKVRDNELAGRDPFDSMDAGDKVAFFKGLESKVEKENQKLSALHEWLHSNIENLDYGADGISLYDPPEKVIPRWKGPPLDTIPEFLNNSRDQQQVESSLQKVNESTNNDNVETSLEASASKSTRKEKDAKFTKTVIEASDGSIKPGKRSGKEYWQHTKKYTRGFLESYNAETDPEVKSVMKDIGKNLDRWITEKEIQDAADLMDKIPQKGKEFIEKKLNKLKREMELFGPQAVVSKYREYAEEKEEDYLWWLDLPHLLCIELYTYDGVDQRIGFYSLEMAADLELEPKPNHVIAFEDPGDSKNFCYILQAHLEMIGKGKAFIVPQPPKDVFRQAKANGFGVTVIRKGELKLNVDQALEEVEEFICEIGSKMYHDKITRERSVDISSLMKGVFGVGPPSKRKRKKRARKRPSKS